MSDMSDIRTVSPEDALRRKNVGEFIQMLLQAFLRTGYYLPDHPETRKAKAGLYEKFAKTVGERGEITLLIGEEQGKYDLLVEGIDDKPLKLSSLMQRGVAETYTSHFKKFLERKEIVYLSLNARMGSGEFSRFVDIMSEPTQASMADSTAKDQFITSLQERQIYNISFVFTEELITERAHVPWRTRMALSRLKKDIHLLPILRNLNESELHSVKLQILSDILRPLGVAELIYSLLLNLDLVGSLVMSEEDGETKIFALTGDTLLTTIGNLFLRDVSAIRRGFPEHVTARKQARILAGLSQRLSLSRDPHAGVLLETLFDKELISLEELPLPIKNRVLTIKRLTTFLMKPEVFLSSFDKETDPLQYGPRSVTMASFVPLLVEREQYNEAIAIVSLFNTHAKEQSSRASLAVQKRSELIFGPTLDLASQKFLAASKESRTLIGHLFQLIGYGSILPLQRILTESDDPWRSKQAAEILVAMGGQAIECLFDVLEGSRLRATTLPAIIHLIGNLPRDIPQERPHRIMLMFIADPLVEIRREALSGLGRINPRDHFAVFKGTLTDPDLKIRKVSVTALGRGGDRRAFELLTALIDTAEQTGLNEDLELSALAIEAIGSLTVFCPTAYDVTLPYLATLVDRFCDRNTLKRFISGGLAQPDSVVLALTELLGKLSGEQFREHLVKLTRHHSAVVAKRAAELFNKQVDSGGDSL
jgi:hypothetical protein